MLGWYLKVVRDNYANFKGRARRKELFYFVIMNNIFCTLLASIPVITNKMILIWLCVIYIFALFVPVLALLVRRMHDTGKSGLYLLITLVPVVGMLFTFVVLCTAGNKGPNQYGDDPKNP